MARKPPPAEDAEIENCYPDENGIYTPWSELGARIDAKWNRIARRECVVDIVGAIIMILIASWVLVATGIVAPKPRIIVTAPSQPQSQSTP